MTKLIQYIEEMRARLSDIASSEQSLVRALGDALSRLDEKLLHDVRHVTAEHEARRGVILNELQVLAARIGSLPVGRDPVAALEDADPAMARHMAPQQGQTHVLTRGDWRQAASNIEDELDFHLNGRASTH